MRLLFVLTCLWLSSMSRYCDALEDCKKVDSCSCKNSTYIVSLWTIAFKNNTARFVISPKALEDTKIYWNPCYNFTFPRKPPRTGRCTDVAICYKNGTDYDNVGDQESVRFIRHPTTSLPTIEYTHRNQNDEEDFSPKIARVMLICSKDYPGTLTYLGEFRPNELDFAYKGVAVCGERIEKRRSGMSAGSILIVVFFVCLSCYLIVGVCYQKFALNRSGWDLVPNRDIWENLVAHIQDGLLFTVTCGKEIPKPLKPSHYDNM